MGVREVKPIFQDNVEHIGSRECMVLPTSGLTGDGVAEGIEWLVQCIKRNVLDRPPKGQEDSWRILGILKFLSIAVILPLYLSTNYFYRMTLGILRDQVVI